MLFAAMDSLATTIENVPACGLQHGILEDNQSGPRHHLPNPTVFPISCQFSFHHFWINQTQGEPFIHPVISSNSRWEIRAKFSTIPWTTLVPDLILGSNTGGNVWKPALYLRTCHSGISISHRENPISGKETFYFVHFKNI